jgi:hypothetical protein
VTIRLADFDAYIPSFDEACFLQSLKKGGPLRRKKVEEPTLDRTPITFRGSWARAISGHVAAAMPRNVMNSRRFMGRPSG